MTADWGRALAFTWREECGHNPKNPKGNVDNPADPGGRTSRGMTQHVYDEWCAAHDLPLGDVWDADDQVIRDIYRAQYWNRIRGDEVAWPLCLALFDTAVLHGPVFAIEELQLALKVKADGRFGPLTMAALKKAGSLDVTYTILQARDDTYEVKDVGRRAQFYHGHEDRCDRLCDACGVARTVDP